MADRGHRVIFSVILYISAGISLTLVASFNLRSSDYAIYVTFAAFTGICLLGPSAALEQEATLIFRSPTSTHQGVLRHLALRASILVSLLIALVLVFPTALMSQFFDEQAMFIKWVAVFGVPGLILSASLRGSANVRASPNWLANSHVVFAMSLFVCPMVLNVLGMSLLRSLILGNIIAWGMPAAYLIAIRVWSQPSIEEARNNFQHLTTVLIFTNLLLIALLLSSQLLFKLQSDWMRADTIADAHLLISISCLSSTLALGLLPYFVGHARNATIGQFFSWSTTQWVLLIGLLLPVLTAMFYRQSVSVFFGRVSQLTTGTAWLISMSATPLVMTVLAIAYVISHERVMSAMWSSGVALTSLWLMPLALHTTTAEMFGFGVFLGSLVGPLTLILANRISGQFRNTAGAS